MRKVILLIIVICGLTFYVLSEGCKRNSENGICQEEQLNVNNNVDPFAPVERTIIFNEAIIMNKGLSNFLITTIAPILREMNFQINESLLEMRIDKIWRGYKIEIDMANSGFLENEELPDGYIEAFCMVEGYPMKVEAPIDCSLIKTGNNKLSLKHNEYIGGCCDWPEWYFHTVGDSLIFDEVRFVLPDQKYEGKVINTITGRLE